MEGYLGLNIEATKEESKDEEVEERLKGLQNLHAQLKTISEASRSDRRLRYYRYNAKMDGKPLEEGKRSILLSKWKWSIYTSLGRETRWPGAG